MGKQNILLRTKKKKALASFQEGRREEAWLLYQAICQADRLDADARLKCCIIAGQRGDHALAEDYSRQAIALDPKLASAHFNLGVALDSQNRTAEACVSFRRAIGLRPGYAEAMEALARAYVGLKDLPAAAQVLQELTAIWPRKAEMLSNLGTIYQAMGRTQDAITAYETALEINPRSGVALNSLGSSYLRRADFAQAERCYRQCLESTPGDLRARSNLLMLLNYLPDADMARVFEEHREWGRVAQASIPALGTDGIKRDAPRRPRVAYLSPDFREHSVASFITPVLVHHDRSRFEIFCYSDVPKPDETTERIKGSVDAWRNIHQLSDVDAARLIREDQIDILIDLAGHTGNNRLGIFAAKPAPLQMTYLGYPNTTGLDVIDYRITDWMADPLGQDMFFSEKLLRLDGCFLTYQADSNTPDVASLPALANGYVTFGSFNTFSKINPQLLHLWAHVLTRVPGSRLLLKCLALTDESVQANLSAALQGVGIGAERFELLGHTPTRRDHLALYSRVDIALDTFPYNGTTTTCEALWMGVPVISLAGRHHAGRVGASLLNAAGLADWLADTATGYVDTAQARASDLNGLARLRSNLRSQLAGSRLCDATGFTRQLEMRMLDAWRTSTKEPDENRELEPQVCKTTLT